MAQSILFPMKYLNITQVWGGGTHTYGFPIDNAGKDTGIDNVVAPFNGVIKKIWANGNSVWLESTAKVLFADGTVDYATAMFTHDNYVFDLSVGQKVPQGQVFYQEGRAGLTTGNHVHIEIARGKFTGTGWYKAPNGQWVINNPYRPDKAFFLNNTIVISSGGLTWKKYVVPVVKPPKATNTLKQGAKLTSNGTLWSTSGKYRAVFQSDGNFVVYKGSIALWSSQTNGKKGVRLVLQTDGNLVIYTLFSKAVWHTGTHGKGGYKLIMQDDGNLVLYTKAGKPLWHTGTYGR